MPLLLGAGTDKKRLAFLLLDNFIGPNGTTPPNHPPDINRNGLAYEDIVAGATIQANQLSDNSGDRIVVKEVGSGNVVIRARMTIQGDNFYGIAFRFQDSTHYFIAGCSTIEDKVAVWINNAGGWSSLDGNSNGSTVFNSGDVIRIEVVLKDASIKVFINDVLGANISNSNFQGAGRHGIYIDGNSWSTAGLIHYLSIVSS